MKKRVFLAFLKSPVSTAYYVEGIRIALGILSGDDDHELTVAYMGDGVRCARAGVDRSYSKGMIDTLKDRVAEGCFYVEEESFVAGGLTKEELDRPFAVAPREKLREMMADSELVLSS